MEKGADRFAAVFVSRRPFYSGKKFLFVKDLYGWDCVFKQYPQGPAVTVRIPKENPVVNELQPSRVYHFESVAGTGFSRKAETVLDLRTSAAYEIVKE